MCNECVQLHSISLGVRHMVVDVDASPLEKHFIETDAYLIPDTVHDTG